MKFRTAASVSAVLVTLLSLSSQALAQVRVIAVAPATAQPGNQAVLTGTSFPAGAISPSNVTAHFAPVTSGAGPTVDVPLTGLVTLVGTTMRATLVIPPALTVSAPTPYQATLSETVAPAFTTTTAGNITINPLPSLVSANPASGRLSQTLNVVVTGNVSNFFQGVSTANFGPGVTVNSVSVASPTSLTANITIHPGATLGATNVNVTTGAEALTLPNGFTILPAPTVVSANPNSGNAGQSSLNIILTGSGTTWLNGLGTLAANFGAGITVNSIVASSDTSATANVSIDPAAAAGARNITVTKGTETAVGTGIFTVVANPVLTTVNPNTGQQGQTNESVTLTGQFTHWVQGTSTASFGAGITVASLTVNSATSATAVLNIDPAAATGARNVTVTTGGEVVTLNNGFTVTAGTPVLTTVNPNTGVQGQTNENVTLTGQFTHWVQGTSTASFGAGITVASLTVNSATSATAVLNIDPAAATGARNVTVTTGGEVVTLNNGFTVTAGTPVLTTVSPNTGQLGQTNESVTLTGQFTHWVQGTSTASFGAGITVVSLTVNSSTSATAVLNIDPAAATGARNVTVTTGGEVVTLNNGFTVTNGSPVLTTVNPNTGQQGQTNESVTLTGQFTHWVQGTSTASFGAGITVASLTVNSSTSATAVLNIDPAAATGARNVTVTTGGEVVTLNNGFTVTAGTPVLITVNPNTGQQGQTNESVTLTGQFTHWVQGTSTASFGAGITVASLTVNSNTSATAVLNIDPAAATGARNVSVTTGGEVVTLTNGFTVNPGTPVLITVNPNTGVQGQTNESVTLTGQFTHWVQGTSTASFGAGITVASLTVNSATSATAVLNIAPAAATGARNVTVTTGAEIVTLTNGFTVTLATPVIISLNPNAGQQGQAVSSVTITGNFTHFTGGTPSISFSGTGVTGALVSVTDDTHLIANIAISPSSAPGGYNVTVVTGAETANGAGLFTVNPGTPVLTTVNPNSGVQGQQNESVTLTGQYTHWVQGTTTAIFGAGVTVNSLTVNSATSATASVTIDPLTALGGRNVTLTTGGEIVTLNGGFTVTVGPAVISSVVSNTGQQGQSLTVTVTGSATHFAQGVTSANFGGGIAVGSINVNSATSATVQLTISAGASIGARGVTLTTGGENASLVNGFTVTAGTPIITSVNPGSGVQGQANLNVAITGAFTHFVQGTTTANFGANITINSVTVTDATDATVNITILGTATTGGRGISLTTGTETVNSSFTVASGSAVILSVTPNSGQQGQSINSIAIVGQGTNFLQGTSTFSLGLGITTSSLTVTDATHATAGIAIDPAAVAGTRTAVMTTGGEVASLNNAFTVTAATPVISNISPNSLAQGATGNIGITGQFTHFSASSGANLGSGIVVNSVTFNSATSLTVNITVSPTANTGFNNVVVTTGTEIVVANNGFQITPGPAVLLSVTPNHAAQGASSVSIAIVGQNTNFSQTNSVASFGTGTAVNSLTVADATHATAVITISAGATPGARTPVVTTGGENAQLTNGFTVNAATPVITSVTPNSGQQQQTIASVTVLGSFTHFVQGTTTANFGTGITINSVTVNNATSATVSIAIAATTNLGFRDVTMTTGAEVVTLTNGFLVTGGPAVISSLTPNNASQGANNVSIAIVGTNTNFLQGTTTVSFGGLITVNSLTVTDATHATASISIDPAAGTGPRSVTATTGGESASIVNGFTVNAATPVLTLVNPATGAQGATIASAAITGQFTHFVQGTSVANFGPGVTVNSTTVTDATHATANITIDPLASLGFRNVSVSTSSETANGGSLFQVTAGPAVISSVTPNSGSQGQNGISIAIVGTSTHFTNGFTTASFGGSITVQTLTLTDATHATAVINIDPAASVGPRTVTLTTQGESASLTNGFTVNAATPVLTSVNPNNGRQGQTIGTVNVVGQFTHFVQGTTTVDFGNGVTTNSVTVTDATHLSVSLTIGGIATLGFHNVAATTGSEVAVLNGGFQVQAGNAVISSVTPNGGQQGVSGLSVAIVGTATNFAQGTSVATFGNGTVTVTSLTVTDTTHATAILTIPANTPTGPMAVTVTTGGEVATLANAFTVTPGTATISSVIPSSAHQGDPAFNMSVVGNFTTFVQGTTTASIGTGITVNSVTVTDSTHATVNLTVTATAAPGLYNVTMTTGIQVATLTNGFTVIAGVPALTSVNPSQASQGASLTVQLNGAFTHFTQGTSTVSFGNGITPGTVTVNGPTQASVPITIANGTAAGPRSVTVTTGTEVVTLTNGFNVQAGTPAITLISPNFGVPNSLVTVALTGQFTSWVNGTTTASFGPNISVGGAAAGAAGPITVSSTTTASASLNIPSGATLQAQNVTVTTGAEVEQVIDGFTVQNSGTTPPTVVSISPAQSSLGAALNTAITVEWSEPMDRTTFTAAHFYLYDSVTGVNVPATISVDASGRISTLTPTQLLAVSRLYYPTMIGGASGIKDALGNALSGTAQYNFTTGFSTTSTGPAFVISNIPAGATGIPLNAPVVLQFSSAINPTSQPAGVQITTGGNPVNGTYVFNAGQTILTFTPTAPLTASTSYTVTYTALLTDPAGNGLTNPGSFSFTTGTAADATGPGILSTDPPASATGVGTNAILRVVFTKPVDPTTISSSNFILYNANNTSITYPGTVAVSADRLSASFTPASPMLPLTQFLWQLYTYKGQNGVADVQNVSQYFTTANSADTTPPVVTAISPSNGATGVPVNAKVAALFSQAIDATSVTNSSITLSPASPGTAVLSTDQLSLTFTPTANLSPTTTYTVSVAGVRDIAGNPMVPFTPTTFTTNGTSTPDLTRPSVTSFVPAASATNVALNSTITININKPINPASVRTDTNNSTDSLAVFMTPSGGSQVQLGGTVTVTNTNTTSQIVFTPANPFEPNSSVTVYVVYNIYMTDYAGNQIIATSETFTTATGTDTTVPHVTSVTPPNGATAVGQNTPVILTFDKPLNSSTVNANTFHLFNGSTPLSTGVTRSADGRTVTLTTSLPSGALVNVVATSGVTDLVGNHLADFSSSFTAATLPPTTRPSVVTMRPGSGATSVPANSPITLIINAPMNGSTIAGALNVAQNGVLVSGTTQLNANGQTILFTPAAPFTGGALVQVFLSAAAADIYGNSLNAFSGQFTVAADLTAVPPTVVSLSPTYGSTINFLNPVILVRFTKAIDFSTVTSSTFYVKQNDSVVINGTLSLFDPYTIQFVPNPRTLSASGQPYYRINMTNGIHDTHGVAFAGALTQYYFYIAGTATLVDNVPPTVTGLAPPDGSTVGDNVIFRATFSKPIDPLTVNANTFMISGGGLTVMPSTISFDSTNQNVTITPQTPMPDSASMTIAISGIADASGNAVTPLTTHFTTLAGADITQPTVVSTSVDAGAVNVPVNSAFVFQFSKAMDSRTLTGTNFYVYDLVLGTYVTVNYSYSADGLTATMTPTSPLAVGRGFQIGARTALDLAGNTIVAFSANFTTAFAPNSVPPTVVDTTPKAGATGIPTNPTIQILFSEPVRPTTLGSVNLLLGGSAGTPQPVAQALSNGDRTLTLTPATLLSPNTQYTISIAGVADTAGNVMVGTVTRTFTSGPGVDLISPTVTSYSPASGQTNVPTNAVIHVSFSEPIDQLSLTNANFRLYNYAQGRYLPATVTVNGNGLSAALVPVSPLLPNNAYQFTINSYTDLAGNIGNGTSISFTTGASTNSSSPTVTSISPANGATGVGQNAKVSAKLSAPLDPTTVGNSSIALTPAVPGTVSLAADQVTLTFTPTGNLAASTPYSVQVSGFTDIAGNAVTTFNSTFTTSATTDTTHPSVTSTVPNAGTTGVSVNSTITININDQVNPASVVTGTGSIDSLAVFATVTAGQFVVGGTAVVTNNNGTNTSQIVFTPSSALPPGATITVYVVYNTYITDFEGNNINATSFTFTTAAGTDTTPPTVTSVTPTNGATGVGPYTIVSLTLSEPLNPNTINANSFALFNGATFIGASISHSSDNRTVMLSYGNLPGSSLITVEATNGATDYAGNALTPFTSSFTTARIPTSTAPSVISQRPGNGATGVATNTTIYLITNKPMNAASVIGAVHVSLNGVLVVGTVSLNPAGTSIVFTPSSPFSPGGFAQIVVDNSATDSDGNPLNAYSGSFTVLADQTSVAPTFVAMNPVYGSNNQPLNSVVDVEFSKPMDATTVTTSNIFLKENDATVIPATVSLLFPNVVRIVPNAPFASGSNYYRLDMPANGLKDTNGNFFAGSVGTYYFYTSATSITDTTAPTITGLAPTNGSTNIGDNALIQVAFSKPVDPLTVNGISIHVTGGSSTVMPASISFDSTGQNVIITPLAPLPDNTAMTIAISGVTDTSGNAVTPQSTTFTTGPGTDTTAPTVIASSVDSLNNTNVPQNSVFTLTFSKPMNTLGLQVPANFYLYDATLGTYITAVTRSFSSDGTVAFINPTSPLPATHTVYLSARNATDLTGNVLSAFNQSFTVSSTTDTTPPTVTATNPGGTVNPPTNSVIQARFNKPVQATSLSLVTLTAGGPPITVTPSLASGDETLTLTPGAPLSPSTAYTVTVTGVNSIAGIPMAAPFVFNFTTAAGAQLVGTAFLSSVPANGATGVSASVTPTVTFSNPVDPVSAPGNLYLVLNATSVVVPSTLSYSADFKTVTITPTAALTSGTTYRIVSNGQVTDQTGKLQTVNVSNTFTVL
jgi:Bacterial Ig-like domain